MSRHILFCETCKKFTMREKCCANATITLKPQKFSLQEKYADYRRKAKYEQEISQVDANRE